jgi:hypothetical protein
MAIVKPLTESDILDQEDGMEDDLRFPLRKLKVLRMRMEMSLSPLAKSKMKKLRSAMKTILQKS